ncbi:DUF3710 domain-containing protein [Allorhizocola rhizosphaerae]|uniref:DUF3710 domain-containing protein n=1 Tax=Allorhizocola rhizosphaerae TaxID=1872709 RepID=UPI001FE3A964|nr:DUF3710 domain-containing protein [Allorhizocola rhizosphaerae]
MIFSRRRGAGRHHKAEGAVLSKSDERRARRAAMLEELDLVEPGPSSPDAPPPQDVRPLGPFDFADAPPGDRVDLGSLLLPAIEGIEIRMQADERGMIQQLMLMHEANSLQLGVFAAPRTDGLWDEVRDEIRKSLFADGVASDEVPGRWGTELRARLRTQEGFDDLRFIGVDGPRWMIRAVYRGPAAIDPAEAGPLDGCLTGLVVRRGEEARPTREALPLQLPEHMRPGGAEPSADPPAAPAPAAQPAEEAPPPPKRKPSPRPRRD